MADWAQAGQVKTRQPAGFSLFKRLQYSYFINYYLITPQICGYNPNDYSSRKGK